MPRVPFVALALLLVPAVAAAAPPKSKPARTARVQKSPPPKPSPCFKAPVEVVAGGESATFPLTRCDGTVAPVGVDQLSILARPGTAQKPKQPIEVLAKTRGAELAPGIRRIDPRLVERLAAVVDNFRTSGQPARILLVSGYRPKSAGSFHSSGRALDFRLEGVTNEALLAFCKTLPDTGCGYYPNSVFVHMDVRDTGAGHVSWIDVSRPGEPPKYVSAWPPPAESRTELPLLPASPDAER
jgi:hypothetical protein